MIVWHAWQELFRAAFHSIWAHRMRSILTTLGIIIGVASVITVVQLTKSLEGRIMADVDKEGSHTFFLSPWIPNKAWKKGEKVRWSAIDQDLIKELRELVPEIQLASAECQVWGGQHFFKVGDQQRRVLIRAMDENAMALSNMEVEVGRGFTPTDRMAKTPVVVLGNNLAKEFDLGPESIGRNVILAGQTAEVIGILKRQGDIPFMPKMGDDDAIWGMDNEAFIPLGSFKEIVKSYHLDNLTWRLQVDPKVPIAEAQELLSTNLRRVRGLRGDDPDNFQLETNRKQVEMVEKLGKTLLTSSGAMVGISLLVGGIGVMNIMLVSVQERTREIGVRKALGAKKRSILGQFLIEAIVLCLVGGVLGLVVGLVLGSILSQWLMQHLATVPGWALGAALGVPALVGVAFGLYPASRAAKLDPIEALRYE